MVKDISRTAVISQPIRWLKQDITLDIKET